VAQQQQQHQQQQQQQQQQPGRAHSPWVRAGVMHLVQRQVVPR